MGDFNQLLFLKKHLGAFEGGVIEIGSRNYGSTQDFRSLFPGKDYLGVDLVAGPGVERVVNLEAEPAGDLGTYGLGICCSVLEHSSKPWVLAERLENLIAVDGYLFVSVPWVWRYHPYPDDYFRFSVRAIESLFASFKWAARSYSTTVVGEMFDLDQHGIDLDNKIAFIKEVGKGKRKYLPYLMVNMLGRRF